MPGCAAINCSNRREQGFKMYRFPKDPIRRKKWQFNCHRLNWKPSTNHLLCEIHFEKSQFFTSPSGKKCLIGTALPTLFDVPNPPPRLFSNRKSLYKKNLENVQLTSVFSHTTNANKKDPETDRTIEKSTPNNVNDSANLKNSAFLSQEDEIKLLRQENKRLMQAHKYTDSILNLFSTYIIMRSESNCCEL